MADFYVREFEIGDADRCRKLFKAGNLSLAPLFFNVGLRSIPSLLIYFLSLGVSLVAGYYLSVVPAVAVFAGSISFYVRSLKAKCELHCLLYAETALKEDMLDIDKYYMKQGRSCFWVAVQRSSEEIVGIVALDGTTQAKKSPAVGELRRMSVVPAAQGKGVAGLLLFALESFARDHGYSSVVLTTTSAQATALRLYTRHGYTHVATRFKDNLYVVQDLDFIKDLKEKSS